MMCNYRFDNNFKTATQQFVSYVDSIIDDIKVANKTETPIPHDERVRRVGTLTDAWMEHAMQWGPPVTDEHTYWNGYPASYQLERLGGIIVAD